MAPLSRRRFLLLSGVSCPGISIAQGRSQLPQPTVHPKSALLVVDAQVGVLASIWESGRVIRNLERLVTKARSAGVPIVWVQHSDDELKYGSDAWQFAPGFRPAEGEAVVHKTYNSAFAATDLDRRLRQLGVSRVVLAGAATNWCIRSTAYAALERGYDLTLVGDAHSTEPIALPGHEVVQAESIVADLNTVFRWVSAPNVSTEVKQTAEVAF